MRGAAPWGARWVGGGEGRGKKRKGGRKGGRAVCEGKEVLQHPTRAEQARPGVPYGCGALSVSVRVTM